MSDARPRSPDARALVRGLRWDVGLPLVGYYGLHLLGVADLPALLAAAGLALLRVVWVAVRDRRLNPFATVMLVVYGLSAGLALARGDAHFLVLKNSFITGALGVGFLATARFGTPLTLAAEESFQPAHRDEIRREYDTDPDFRHGHRVSSAVWGAGLLAESLVRVPLVYLLPIDVMVGVGEVMSIATIAVLIAWTVWYGKRMTAQAAAADHSPQTE